MGAGGRGDRGLRGRSVRDKEAPATRGGVGGGGSEEATPDVGRPVIFPRILDQLGYGADERRMGGAR